MTRRRAAALAETAAWLWRWSLVVTLPATAIYVLWLTTFAGRFGDFRLRFDIGPHPFGFASEGGDHARQLLNDLQFKLTGRALPTALRALQLEVRGDRLAMLDANLPHSGFSEVKGQLRGEDGWLDVDVRYRGDFWYHWAYRKKSWRIQVKKQRLAFGMSKFHVIAPKLPTQINDVAAYRLADMLGVLVPRARTVVLFVNGENRGLHLLVEHPQESLLRDRGRMPSDLYAGELIARDAWPDLDNFVFDHPGLWSKMAANNHLELDNRGPLRALCAVLAAPPTEASMARLGELVDLEAFGRFLAVETLLQSLHNDEIHNWRLCYDPWRQRFQPLLWDPNAWGSIASSDQTALAAANVSLDPASSRLQLRLLSHPTVLAARARALHEFLRGGRASLFLAELRELVASASAVVGVDPRLRPPNPGAVQERMQRLPAMIEQLFSQIDSAWSASVPVTWNRVDGAVVLEIADRMPITAVTLESRTRVPAGPLQLCWSDGDFEHCAPLSVSALGDGTGLRCEVALPAQLQPQLGIGPNGTPLSTRQPLPTTYTIRSPGGLTAVRAVVVERASGYTEHAVLDEQLRAEPIELLLGIGRDQQPPAVHWSGTVSIEGTRTIDSDLFLAAGTEVLLGPGACLVIRGRLLANAAESSPIRFRRADSEPWGAVVLQGPGSSGSRLQHCVFDGGSGSLDDDGLFEYSGMLSVHDAQRISLQECTFQNSTLFDDVVHAVYADIELSACHFHEAPSDGLDLDQCRATVLDCHFHDMGNDGLDLMTCDAIVRDCTFTGCGDKGISIGERSRVLVANSRFADCVFGIQSKDDSDAAALNCTLTGGTRALDTIVKNWRYGKGGRLIANRCKLLGATTAPRADDGSRLVLRDSTVDPTPAAAANLRLEGCDRGPESPAQLPRTELPFSIRGRQGLATSIWQQAPVLRRGAL